MLDDALDRETGMLVLCGPTGSGKTTLANALLSRHPGVVAVGDLREPENVCEAFRLARRESVVGIVRSGGSFGLASRWDDMGIPRAVVGRASVITVTLRRPPRASPVEAGSCDILVAEIIGADRVLLTRALAEEAAALVEAGVISEEAARYHVPGFD